jgi:hypothetical protein
MEALGDSDEPDEKDDLQQEGGLDDTLTNAHLGGIVEIDDLSYTNPHQRLTQAVCCYKGCDDASRVHRSLTGNIITADLGKLDVNEDR